MKPFKVRRFTTVTNHWFASAKHMAKIIAYDTKECDSHYDDRGKITGYYRKWVIKKEPEGYIFREISFNEGICGHGKTIRDLIIKSSSFSNIKIVLLTDDESLENNDFIQGRLNAYQR